MYVRGAHEDTAAEVEDDEDGHAVLPPADLLTVSQVEDDTRSVTDIAALTEVVKLQDRHQTQDRCVMEY